MCVIHNVLYCVLCAQMYSEDGSSLPVVIAVYSQCFMLLVWQQEVHPACKILEWWGAGMVICLERGADATATLSLASVKSRLVLPFWYRLTQVVLDKGQLNGCVCI